MLRSAVLVVPLLLGSAAAARAQERAPAPTQKTAVAVLEGKSGEDVRGTVRFVEGEGGLRIVADVKGLAPGLHGFHVHETGDCSAPDASSAGGHFEGSGPARHGPADVPGSHAGDLGNLRADAGGAARFERVDPGLSLRGPSSILGRAVVVHAGADDLSSQPAGDAGGRVACGVIRPAPAR